MRKRSSAATLAVCLALALPAAAADDATVALGKRVYEEQRCRLCHSVAGKGNAKSPLDGVGGRLSAADIRRWIVEPQAMRPGVKKKAYDLPEDRLEALVAWLASLR